MKHQLQTIRTGLEAATCYTMLGFDAHSVQTALTALSELERMAGEQEPVAWVQQTDVELTPADAFSWAQTAAHSLPLYTNAPVAQQPQYEAGDMASAHNDGFRAGVASVAQQPQARPDFTDEWTGYLKDGETPFERFLRERKDLSALTKLYQRALEENERLKAQQPQANTVKVRFRGNGNPEDQFDFADLKQPQAEAALDRMAENERELGIQMQAEAEDELCPSCRNLDLYACTCTSPRNKANATAMPGMVEFLDDLNRSRTKYPNNARMWDGLMGEIDELRRAYHGDGDQSAEAFDVAVCAFRIATEGDAGGNTLLTAPKQAEAVPSDVDVEAAAKKMAEIFDYPWDFMPEKGRNTMRENVRAVLAAAQGEKP